MHISYRGFFTSSPRAIICMLAFVGIVSAVAHRAAALEPASHLQVHDLKTLSLHDRQTLPDTTKVTIKGKVFTLGVLRQNHAALVASRNRMKSGQFANLRSLAGADYSFTKTFAGNTRVMTALHVIPNRYATPTPVPHLIPLKIATPTPIPPNLPLVGASNGVPYPTDYRQFCGSLPATVCLYYPPGVTWFGQDQYGNYQTIDTLITDKGVCSQEGGQIGTLTDWWSQYGCIYSYPSSQTVNFLPPPHGFTTAGWCDPNPGYFGVTTDSHGAVRVSDAGAAGFSVGWGYVSGGPGSEQFCFLQVKLTQ